MESDNPAVAAARITYKQGVTVAFISVLSAVITALVGIPAVRDRISEMLREPPRMSKSDGAEMMRLQNALETAQKERDAMKSALAAQSQNALAAAAQAREIQAQNETAEAAATAAAQRDKETAVAATAAAQREIEDLRRQLKEKSDPYDPKLRPALYSAFSTTELPISECMSRGERIATNLGATVTKRDNNAVFLSRDAYAVAVQCIASARLVSFVIAGPDGATASRLNDQLRGQFIAAD